MRQKDSERFLHLKGLKLQESMVEKVVVQGKNCLRIPLTKNQWAIIDECDYEKIRKFKWSITCSGNKSIFYAYSWIPKILKHEFNFKKHIMMHQLISGLTAPDHINGDGLDNRRCNLRKATSSQNMMNQRKQTGTSSKYKGVYLFKQPSKWMAKIQFNKKTYYLGYFLNEMDAAIAYDKKAKEFFGEFAKLNVLTG